MIFIPHNSIESYNYCYFLLSHIEINDPNFFIELALSKTETTSNSYGEQLSKQLVSPIFNCAYDLKKEYENFYLEYESFEKFLYNKYLMDENEIYSILSKSENHSYIYYGALKNGMSYNLGGVLHTDEIYQKIISKLIGDLDNENKN
ncbi:hypothetical protein P7H62_06825 [Vagococcus carniphilus]|uniref:Uncharacterized protein n=1 Tax=Vagococcus carniphilus TaxID=218144 RepID=A0AAW8U6D4_9ENTE|nr:hypothetical protein [Vagococcus carniphilus]MDT2831150.1 hypothetical protein [Vagococcus carniphilus]MDT2833337.1 hypothetical protein [Vagococcus carniphilus]MDT2839691.1 hypothetical protein [Vagococcus carniphilus]MDT2854160.1 hypothetical protein [Vagococcus carniphilus]